MRAEEMLTCECGHPQISHEFDHWSDLGSHWGVCTQPGCRCTEFDEAADDPREFGRLVDRAYEESKYAND